MACALPKPQLHASVLNDIPILTDDALASSVGVRVAFTGRTGGVSVGPYQSLNLATHVFDDRDTVMANRRLLACAVGVSPERIVVPDQVHGTEIVTISDGSLEAVRVAQTLADAGADALVVEADEVAALLCCADCLPAIIVSPTGRFGVVHAGWRGAVAGIAGKAVRELARLDALDGPVDTACAMNVYIGPHIHVECFETGPEVREQFVEAFGEGCVADGHVDLSYAVSCDVVRAGVDSSRIVIAPYCTKCHPDEYFSYRASGGTCGRNGAFAVRTLRFVENEIGSF